MQHYNVARTLMDELQDSLFPTLQLAGDDVDILASTETTITEHFEKLLEIRNRLEGDKATCNRINHPHKYLLGSLENEYSKLKNRYEAIQFSLTQKRNLREREELLRTANGPRVPAVNNIREQVYFAEEKDRLLGADREVDQMLSQGAAVLNTLCDQRSSLQSMRSKIGNVVGTLGLSSTVLRLIEKRKMTDKYVFFGLMVFSIVGMVLTWMYLL